MTLLHAIALTFLMALHLPAFGQTPRRDGNWEITVEVEIEGAAGRVPPRTMTQCISKEEAAEGKKVLPQTGTMPSHCTASEHKVEGNKVSWSFKCEAPQPMSGTGEIVYSDENSYTGLMKFVRDGKTMAMKYTGKRLGDCTKQ